MKRYDVWLGVVLGITAGLFGGFFLGQNVSDNATKSEAPRIAEKPGRAEAATVATGESPAKDWFKRYAGQFAQASEHEATPGLTQAAVDALRAESPFDQARMVMLIEMMRKEDFPVLLEVMRKAKSNMNANAYGGQGPPMWIAFWRRFGEIDPDLALTKALECKDLDYFNRKFLEKTLFNGMARHNPSGAANAFAAHPELPNRAIAVEGIMEQWAKSDPATASAWAVQNLEGETLNAAIYATAWGASRGSDISGGIAYLKGLPETAPRDSAVRSLKSQIRTAPQVPANQVLDFVAATRLLGARDRKFEAQMASRCAESDPFAAANFFARPLPDGAANDYAELRIVTAQWVRRDQKAAESWAKGQEGMPHYVLMAAEFAQAAQERNDDAAARRWLELAGVKETPPR
jgi:hypothetical protein